MALSRNVKPIESLDLISGEFEGYYLLSDGNVMEAHETIENWFDADDLDGGPEPDGAVYYTTYQGAEEFDGGLMGYMAGDTFANVIAFMSGYGQPVPVRMIARDGTPEYDALADALDFEDTGALRSILAGLVASPNRKGWLR